MDTGLAARSDLDVTEAFLRTAHALGRAQKGRLAVKKNNLRTARGRVRQVARLRRARRRRRQLRETVAPAVPRIDFYVFTITGTSVFGIAIVLILLGNPAAALPLFPAADAACGPWPTS